MTEETKENYREWFGERTTFFREFKLHFGQCDARGRISLPSLLLITSDTAVEDYFQRGLSVETLAENGIVILVSRLSFSIHKYPRGGERLLLKTWEEKPDGMLLSRKYELENAAGESLVSGTSLWLIADPATRRLIKPSAFTMRPEADFVIPVDCPPCSKIHRPQDMQLLGERTVGFSDLDSNGHTNNSRYAAFALDALPESFQTGDVQNFRINYAKEAKGGDRISLSGYFSDDGKTALVAGDVQGRTCFEAEITLR